RFEGRDATPAPPPPRGPIARGAPPDCSKPPSRQVDFEASREKATPPYGCCLARPTLLREAPTSFRSRTVRPSVRTVPVSARLPHYFLRKCRRVQARVVRGPSRDSAEARAPERPWLKRDPPPRAERNRDSPRRNIRREPSRPYRTKA